MADSQPEERQELRPPEKSLVIFGRDISKIPCFRNSLLCGITGGLGCGLGYFLFTSRVGRACNFAVYSFSAITLAYWFQCRYQYSKNKFELMRLQQLMREQAIYEGSSAERVIDSSAVQEGPVEV